MLEKLKGTLVRGFTVAKTKVWYSLLLIFPFADQIISFLLPYLPRMLQHGGVYKWMGYAIVAIKAALQFYEFIAQLRSARAAADAAVKA